MKKRTITFKASTQYNDWLGTIALDSADMNGIVDKFEDVLNDEHILGVDAYCSSNIVPNKPLEISVTVYTGLIDLDKFGNRISKTYPIVKQYTKEMTLEEFAKLFKRINLTFSTNNILETSKIKIEE